MVTTTTANTTAVSYRTTWRQTDPPDPAHVGATPRARPPSRSGGHALDLPQHAAEPA